MQATDKNMCTSGQTSSVCPCGTMDKKEIDHNDYWYIKDNPLSKVGVFPYLGRQISEDLEPDKIYQVLRPKEELSSQETLDSFKLVPIVDDHTMLGTKPGMMPAEEKGVHGVIGDDVYYKDGTIYGDLKIFSESLKEEIENGKKELSMGYFCDYELKNGEYARQPYQAIQRNLRINHVALVDEGRMGGDVRVMDKKITFDSMTFDDDVQWITTKNGNHIPVGEGQTKKEAIQKHWNKANKETKEKEKQEVITEHKLANEYFSSIFKNKKGQFSDKDAKATLAAAKFHLNSPKVYLEKQIGHNLTDLEHKKLKNDLQKFIDLGEQGIKKVYNDSYKQAFKEEYGNDSNNLTQNEGKKALDTNTKKGENSMLKTQKKSLGKSALDEDIEEITKDECKTQDEDVDKRALIDEIGGILKDKVDEELWRTIVGKIEKLAYNDSEEGANDEDDIKEDDKKTEDEDPVAPAEPAVVETEETVEGETKVTVSNGEAEVAVSMDSMIKEIGQRDALVEAVRPLIGDNAKYRFMSTREVAKYACDKLDLKVSNGQEVSVLRGYIAGHKKSEVTYSLDNAVSAPAKDSAFEAYLKGGN